jgi:hypothetical protein
MNRRDYITIAKAIRNVPISKNSRMLVVNSIISMLKSSQIVDDKAFRAMANAEDDDYKDPKVFIKAKVEEDDTKDSE